MHRRPPQNIYLEGTSVGWWRRIVVPGGEIHQSEIQPLTRKHLENDDAIGHRRRRPRTTFGRRGGDVSMRVEYRLKSGRLPLPLPLLVAVMMMAGVRFYGKN